MDNIEQLRVELIEGLEKDLERHIETENYEECAKIKERLDILKGTSEKLKIKIKVTNDLS